MKLHTFFRLFFIATGIMHSGVLLYATGQDAVVLPATSGVENKNIVVPLNTCVEQPTYEQVAQQQELIAQMMHTRTLKRYAAAAALTGYAAYAAKGWLFDALPAAPVPAKELDENMEVPASKKYVHDLFKKLSSPSFFEWTSLGGIPIPYVSYAGAANMAKSLGSYGFYLALIFGIKYVFFFKKDIAWFSQEELNLKTRLEEVEVHAFEVERDPNSVAKKQLLIIAANAYVRLLTRLAGFMEYQRAYKASSGAHAENTVRIEQDPLAVCIENLMVAIHEFVDDINKLLNAKNTPAADSMTAKRLGERMSERVNALIVTYTHELERA